ncbi:MAG: polyphenol oxidase family protein, partial [Armatimonadota bacterium]|nr:polyphenol oxidase family protein [Armatimonadota bacterium]
CSSGSGAYNWESALPATDALIVQAAQVPVLILVADCAPILLVDPVHRVLAVVHAGWRGAVAGIASRTVARMQTEFGTKAQDVRGGIGPCLCPDCFEVGDEVAQAAAGVAPESIIPAAPQAGQDKPLLDLRVLLSDNLREAGVPTDQIEALPHCPRCMNDLFFSHRGQNGMAGRFGLVAWWEDIT